MSCPGIPSKEFDRAQGGESSSILSKEFGGAEDEVRDKVSGPLSAALLLEMSSAGQRSATCSKLLGAPPRGRDRVDPAGALPAAGDSRRREELAAHRRLQWVKDNTI